MAEHTNTTPGLRRPRRPDNVVALPRRPTETEAIVAEVEARAKQQKDVISARLRELVAWGQAQHRERANELVQIGLQMDRPTLDNLIEIGQRMLGARGGA